MPVGVGQARADCGRKIAKVFCRNSQVFQLIDIACVILSLCVEIRDAALGSSHWRCVHVALGRQLG
jgi:uncharacterized membrane protein YczE